MRVILDRLVKRLGLRLVKAQYLKELHDKLSQSKNTYYQYQYEGGYEEYRKTQIFYNKKKIERVWADDQTLSKICEDLRANGLTTGLCHGARNGYEVQFFREQLDGDTIGTDIADTASQFPNMITWDFHDENPEWIGKFDFVYTNSHDQAFDPRKALTAWARQIKPNGRIYLEHSIEQSPMHAGKMDPFGAYSIVMPYLLFEWGKGIYRLIDILYPGEKPNIGKETWVFILALEQS